MTDAATTSVAPKKKPQFVNVYCKLPNGITYPMPDGRKVRLVGFYGDERSPLQVSGLPGRNSIAGFGVTRNVESELWDEIVKAHGKSLAHKNGLIFAQPSTDKKSGAAQAKDQEREKTGLEPIDPTTDKMRDKAQGSKAARQREPEPEEPDEEDEDE